MTSHVKVTCKRRERFRPLVSFVFMLSVCLLVWLCNGCVCLLVKQWVTCFWGFNTNDPQTWPAIVPGLLICLCSSSICLCGRSRTRQSQKPSCCRVWFLVTLLTQLTHKVIVGADGAAWAVKVIDWPCGFGMGGGYSATTATAASDVCVWFVLTFHWYSIYPNCRDVSPSVALYEVC